MNYYSRIFFGHLWWACSLVFCVAVAATSAPLEQPDPETPPPQISMLASEAYSLLSDLPHVGVDQAKGNLERLIASARELQAKDGSWETQLSLALREAIAHGLVYEMYRSEAMRLGIGLDGQPASIPFEKHNFLELWDANLPNDAQVLSRTRRGNDVIVDVLTSKGVGDADLVAGTQLDQIPRETRARFDKLRRQANDYSLRGKKLSADEQFVQSLVVLQSLRDLDVIVRVYDKSGLFKDRAELRAAIDTALQGAHKKRMDDGMRASSLKVLSAFGKYCSASQDAYLIQQAMLLGSYMANTEDLPAQMQSHLDRRRRELQSSDDAKQCQYLGPTPIPPPIPIRSRTNTPAEGSVLAGVVGAESAAQAVESLNHDLSIANENYSVSFEGTDIAPELKQAVITDLTLNLSHYDHIEFMELPSAEDEPAAQKYRGRVTHWLDAGNQQRCLPDALETYFGGAVKTGDTYQLIIHEELVEEYRQALKVKAEHEAMFAKLDEFIELLGSKKMMEALAGDLDASRSKLFFYKEPPPRTGEGYMKMIQGFTDVWIRRPSLLDVKPLSDVVKQGVADSENAYVFSTLVSDAQRNPKYMMKLPVGVFVDGEWRILVMPPP